MPTANELNINTSASALDMANEMFGAGMTVISATYSGDAVSSGIYTGATATLEGEISPTDSGVILSTGNAVDFTNSSGTSDTNTSAGTGTNTSGGIDRDPLLDAASGQNTFDGAILETTFTATGDTLTMQFVFSSEEYLEYTNQGVNDVFGIWVNGQQIDLSFNNERVSIDTVNNASNSNLYIDNPAGTDPYNTEMDGFTVVLSVKADLLPGTNTLRVGIADGGDSIYDSNVMIAANSVQSVALAFDDTFTMGQNSTAVLAPLANDDDLAGGGLTITQINGEDIVVGTPTTLSTGETIVVNADGTITVATDGDVGSNAFTYTIEDVNGTTDVGYITLTTEASGSVTPDGYVDGSAGADLIDTNYAGDPNGDVVDGGDRILAGITDNDDVIRAYGGDDTVLAGGGNDSVDAGSGNDSVDGGAGNDTIEGGTGNDTILGDTAADQGGAQGGQLSVTIDGQNGAFDGAVLAEITSIDGTTRIETLTSSYDSNIGVTFNLNLEPGDGVRVGITANGSSPIWSTREDMVRDTANTGSSVELGFEDGGGGSTFDDVELSVGITGDTVLRLPGGDGLEPGGNAELINNGSFEGDLSGWTLLNPTGGQTVVYSTGNRGATINSSNEAAGGDGIEQDVTTVVGETYSTSIEFATNGSASSTHTALIEILDSSGTVIGTESVAVASGNITVASLSFVATTPDTTIRITNPSTTNTVSSDLVIREASVIGPDAGGALDNPAGNDSLLGGEGDDLISGLGGDDTLIGGAGADTLLGGGNDDLITDSAGVSSVEGGDGDDTIITGDDNDVIYGDNASGDFTYSTIGSNLIVNGSFEDLTGTYSSSFGAIGVGSIVGWSSDDPSANFDLHNDGKGGTYATDGSYVLDMGGTPDNLDVYQDVSGMTAGTPYALSFDAGDLAGLDNNSVEVYFGGELIATIDPGAGTMDSFSFIVTGGMGDGTDRLRFNEIGPVDVDGLQIDNVTLFEAVPDSADDVIDGGLGDDTVFAGLGDDTVVANQGADSISGNEGNDSLSGGTENDTILGGDGNDTLSGGADNDSLEGGTGDDNISGGTGDDFLRGSFGNDSLEGGTGNDYLWGGFGDDTIALENGFGNDTIEGEEDEETTGDVLDLSAITDDLTVDLTSANPEDGTVTDGVSTASFVEIENIVLGAGNDTLVLADFGGADTIQSFTGPITNPDGSYTAVDMLDVTALTSDFGTTPVNARDVVVTDDGSGNAVLTFPGGESLTLEGIDPVAASDPAWLVAVGIPSNEIVDGTSGADAMGTTFVDVEGDQTDGTDGLDDTIYGYGGDDTIDGGLGDDTIEGGADNDSIDGGAGADTILGGTENDTISGGTGADTIEGEAGNDSLSGGDDTDADSLIGGFGDDTLVLEGGADTADGQDGDDTFELQDGFGNSSVVGGEDGETDGDTLDLSNMTDDTTVDLTSIFPEEGTVTSGSDTLSFQEIENIVLGGGTDTLVLADGSGGDTVAGFEAPTANGDGTFTGNDLLDVTNLNSDLAGTIPVTTADVTVIDDGNGNAQLVFPNGENLTLEGIDPTTADNPAFLFAIGIPNDGVVSGYGADDTIDGSYTGDLDGDLVDSADGLDDTIMAGGGNDSVLAGAGDDTVFGEDGNDTLAGEGGTNTLIGGEGDDVFVGGAGADSFVGDAGSDSVDYSASAAPVDVDLGNGLTSGGDAGNDTLGFSIEGVTGSTGDDTLAGGDSTDTNVIDGNDGNDAIDGRGGADSLLGGAGDDTIVLGEGNDTASGGADADTFILDSDADGNDTNSVAGGETGTDEDTLDFTNVTTSGVGIVTGATESGTATWGGNEVFYVEIENIAGTDLDDTVSGALDTSGLNIEAGAGDDSLVGGTGDDVFEGEADNDTLIGGAGNDTLTGGLGDDSIDGGSDDDILTGGLGSDTISGGAGTDIISAGDDADVIVVGDGDGANVIDGGSGGTDQDTLDAGSMTEDALIDFTSNEGGTLTSTTTSASFSDIEAVETGAGDDTIDGSATTGGIAASGGAGDDSLIGGTGLDSLAGGDDDDTFSGVYIGDTVDGGDGGTDNDTLDLTGTAAPGGSLQINTSGPDSDGNGFDGVVEYYDNTGTLTGTMSFSNIENFVPCFTPGTLIKTPCGERAVESLVPGDRVLTRDNGFQTIRWAGQRVLEPKDLEQSPELRPVRIRAGALGPNTPERDMMVSPQHRMLVTSAQAELYFGDEEVLIAAIHMTCIDGVDQIDVDGLCYVHILFDYHEIVMSDGTWSESFQPGDMTMSGMNSEQRDEIYKLFPELKHAAADTVFPAARSTLRAHEAQVVLLS